ncbi:MAG: hypothetical protein M1821_004216 [Bathelium mastoideum]|nr:MAG: hypothetical protein M1821_004216 [Bathelium mastoideum]
MPAITRSKTRLLAAAQTGEPQLLPKPPKTIKRRFDGAESASEQPPNRKESRYPAKRTQRKAPGFSEKEASQYSSEKEVSHESSQKKPPHNASGKTHQGCGGEDALQTLSNKELRQYSTEKVSQGSRGKERLQYSSEKESSRIDTELPSPVSSNRITKSCWPCLHCSCPEGFFEDLIDNCVQCGHTMNDHELHRSNPWNPYCDYMCEREELVASALHHARSCGVVVIRATPFVGKTTLLQLLGIHVVYKEPDLEPVYLSWTKRDRRDDIPYEEYLERSKAEWRKKNAALRPGNPNARPIFFIDEAQESYEEDGFWSSLKNYHLTRNKPIFVLVCVYGATGISRIREPNIESQAQQMHKLQRIELRPSMYGNPCMLFRKEETAQVMEKFAIDKHCKLEDRTVEYIHSATDGHPGMVALMIMHVIRFFEPGKIPRALSPSLFHYLMIQRENGLVDYLSWYGRGVWTSSCEEYVRTSLRTPTYRHLNLELLDIQKALREVAINLNGLSRVQEDFDAFSFCHKWGLLHTEPHILGSEGTTFTFASPLHRRVAYRRLFPGREPDAVLESLSLQQVCVNAIARFSPSTLQKRRNSKSKRSWGIPEAAFQDELYCCLGLELHCLPILPEYSHTGDGRIDFLVSDRKWGIEILQCGGYTEIAEHAARFSSDGSYAKWGIMEDYVILNFCPRSALHEVKIDEPDELTAEVYTHDIQLHQRWSLGEGRQRSSADDFYYFDKFDEKPENVFDRLLKEGLTPREQDMWEQIRHMKLQMLAEKEREKKETRHQTKLQIEDQMKAREKEMKDQMEAREKEMKDQMEAREKNVEAQEKEIEAQKKEIEHKMEEMRRLMERNQTR